MRWDLPLRIVPLLGTPVLLAVYTPLSFRALGLTLEGSPRQVGLSLLLAPPIGLLAWWYRRGYVGRMVTPTRADAWFQSAYYVVLNTPAEELFFRGLLLGGLSRVVPTPAAWVVSTLVFGLYHIPSGWGWNAVGGVTAAGGFFGLLFLAGPGGASLLLPCLVHAVATCAFLSAGPALARAAEARRSQRA